MKLKSAQLCTIFLKNILEHLSFNQKNNLMRETINTNFRNFNNLNN